MPGHPCPVCDYPNLSEPPRSEFGGGSFEICPSCGFQFGVNDDDEGISYETWRRRWEARGMPWSGLGMSQPSSWRPVAKYVAPGGAALRRPGEAAPPPTQGKGAPKATVPAKPPAPATKAAIKAKTALKAKPSEKKATAPKLAKKKASKKKG